ncbi:MAG: ATP-binding protein [Leptospiraceae bacterium]|nr:ATP-binding protein [Leptospiraceae bacterium]MCB1303510.1 ATP-binding protein [Leptospiraceae bacterium]
MAEKSLLEETLQEDSHQGPFVELKFGPRWTYVSAVRSFMQNFLAVTFEDKQKADRISMAVSELVENAVKYSDREHAYIRMQVSNDNSTVQVLVVNHASEAMANELKTFMEEIRSMEPLEAYMMMMKRSVDDPGRSRLGLARIRYEARGEIESLFGDGRIQMKAEFS